MRVRTGLAALLLLPMATPVWADLNGDARHGGKLYSKYCAGQCHTAKVHQRDNVRATNQAKIVSWIQRQCTQAMSQNLSVQDIEDLATYLNDKYYHYDH
ncbi:MAG TPA: cytochrome c [Gammaproteobacteria bacterium]|nr:cytochrome c [Gammaproteobacteria bacterium]